MRGEGEKGEREKRSMDRNEEHEDERGRGEGKEESGRGEGKEERGREGKAKEREGRGGIISSCAAWPRSRTTHEE